MNILVTGGAGYIGSTTCKLLASHGSNVTTYDNLSTGHAELVRWGELVNGDIRDTARLAGAMSERRIDAVIHFAARAYVGESVAQPGLYYDNNVAGTLSLLEAMRRAGVGRLVVSSSCAVYGQPENRLIDETTPIAPLSPYGASKAMMERICTDFGRAHGIRFAALRYFNACGTDPELETGEWHDPEPHVIPRLLMAATGELSAFGIFGTDYPTEDGTAVRDYIHVADLADAHWRAVQRLEEAEAPIVCNLGTGRGVSVRQLVDAASAVAGRAIATKEMPRREGDPAQLVADASAAKHVLGWAPRYSDLPTIMQTAWAWHGQQRALGRVARS
jgi:UDP-glucose-4-epimerase GalE